MSDPPSLESLMETSNQKQESSTPALREHEQATAAPLPRKLPAKASKKKAAVKSDESKKDKSEKDDGSKKMSAKERHRRIEKVLKHFCVTKGKGFKLSRIDPGDTGGLKSKKDAKEYLKRGVEWLADLQDKL